jgi:hypothetical protein
MPDSFIKFVPFLAATCIKDGRPKLNIARIIEIAITLAVLIYGMNIAVTKLEVKMDIIERHVSTLDDRLYKHMEANPGIRR